MDNFAPNELGSVNVDKTHFGSDSATGMLLSLAAKAGRDVSSLEEILQCVKPHPLLIDFPRCCR